MASTIDNRFLSVTGDVPLSNLNRPSPMRITPVAFGLGQDSWNHKNNIWQVTSRTFDSVSNDEQSVSPTRSNRLATTDTSKVVARAPISGGHNRVAVAGTSSQTASLSTSRSSRPIGSIVSPIRSKYHGTFGTELSDTTMRHVGRSSLLPGSAPDIEPCKSTSSSSSTSAKPLDLTIGRSFRRFNVEDAEEFVPSYLQDSGRHFNLTQQVDNSGAFPEHFALHATRVVGQGNDQTMSAVPPKLPTYGNHGPSKVIAASNRGALASGEATNSSQHHLVTNSAHFTPTPLDLAQSHNKWASGLIRNPSSIGNKTSHDQNSSSLRPDVASYQPPQYINGVNNGIRYQSYNGHAGDVRPASQVRSTDFHPQNKNQHMTIANSNAFSVNAAAIPSSYHTQYMNGSRPNQIVPLDMNRFEQKDIRLESSAKDQSYQGSNTNSSIVARIRPGNDSLVSYNGSSMSQPYHITQYEYPPEIPHTSTDEPTYGIGSTTRMVPYLYEGGYNADAESEAKDMPRSELLEEFRAYHKSRKYELKEIYGYIVEFSGDQNGSRFIQTKLEQANSDEKDQIFSELQTNARQLMSDVFGNYVIQKMFDYGNQSQKKTLASYMQGYVLKLSLQPYGCRCVQKAFEHILTDQQVTLIKELEGHVMTVVESQHGNHVIQKAIECIPGEYTQFIIDAHKNQIVRLSKHIYGCRIIQRMLEHCSPHVKRSILDELQYAIPSLIGDQYGNYVIQCIIRKCDTADRYRVVEYVKQQVFFYSTHKFASNVVEKALQFADDNQRSEMIRQLTTPNPDNGMQSPVPILLRDQYGNYVMQTVLKTVQGPARRALASEVQHYLRFVGKVSRGKQISAMADTVNAITAGHSPSSISTGPQTPRTPTSVNSAGGMGTPTSKPIDLVASDFQLRDPQRHVLSFKPLHE